ncbi:DUF3710 domain-containing protein [Ornithinimicrobium cerasi]|uniref:DUF3710 domain-containing protein n=1 Tax=Ornithinimicrobium cerasi TaxID=2248773 RepID=A0A285VBC4_9MICO|nr:DUF3710 domain-containing protein [Ornithinimicrobium cerasi]SOC51360.1 Protein of unknown function [Ornithinimicrobium cerasi]
MGLFGRKKTASVDDVDVLVGDGADDVIRPEPAPGEPGVDRDWDRAGDGPYDVAEWPDLEGRVDLGALRLPAVAGMQMRLDIEQGTGRVVGATVTFGASQAQVQVFAAPRTLGLWDELRPEIARGLVDAGGAAETVQGVMGKELHARMPGRAPDGRVAFQPARFLGIDGPRWFLRVVVNGPAAADDAQMAPVLSFVRSIVVRRGDEPRPPREVLELTAPQGVLEAAAKQAQARREQAARAAAEQVAQQAPSLARQDATQLAGIRPGAGPASTPDGGSTDGAGRHRPPEAAPTEAPKAPSNPEFT